MAGVAPRKEGAASEAALCDSGALPLGNLSFPSCITMPTSHAAWKWGARHKGRARPTLTPPPRAVAAP